tara:strand:+ start:177 stop:392 length:216 start_codon:yes stop_codon:yes gene_type:complete
MNTSLDTLVALAASDNHFFVWHLIGALKVSNPELLEEIAREYLRVYTPDALVGFDAIVAEDITPFPSLAHE